MDLPSAFAAAGTTPQVPNSLRNAADAKISFPALNYAYEAGFRLTLVSDGAGRGGRVAFELRSGRGGTATPRETQVTVAPRHELGRPHPRDRARQGLCVRLPPEGGPLAGICYVRPLEQVRAAEWNSIRRRALICVGARRYREGIYGRDDDDWMPEEPSAYFAFESKYQAASKRIMTTPTVLELSKAGCEIEFKSAGGAKGEAFSATSFVDALETFQARCAA